MSGTTVANIFQGRFPGFLCDELKDRGIKFWTKWKDGTLTGRLVFIFKDVGALEIDIAKASKKHPVNKEYRDNWKWVGPVGRGVEAVESYLDQSNKEPLPAPMKRSEVKIGGVRGKLVRDLSKTAAEMAMERALDKAKCPWGKDRKLNEDGSLRHVIYAIGKGNEIELLENGSLRFNGKVRGVVKAVWAAEAAYLESLPPASPSLKKWSAKENARRRAENARKSAKDREDFGSHRKPLHVLMR